MTEININTNNELLETLHGLIAHWEHEVVEFKQASKEYSREKIGQYFSAISNEANLKGYQYGWLVFGVENNERKIVGTNYRDSKGLDVLKHEIASNTTNGITFLEIYEIYEDNNRVIMFKIPAAVPAIPTAWNGHYYGRNGESLSPLSLDELDRLRVQVRRDWSSEIIDNSSINMLDKEAITIARNSYKAKQNREHIVSEIDTMSDEAFLTKLRLLVDGKLTNAAMVLLGNPFYDNLIGTTVRVMWRLYGSDSIVKDYFEFNIPYITVVDRVYAKMRNLTYRYMPDRRSLNTIEISKYDVNLQRELLFNSIAHMDYTQGSRIYVDEYEDYFLIQNPGTFLPGNVPTVLQPWYISPYYKNQLLAESMTYFNMIDTVAMGIRRVFRIQQERLFPMPDYFFMKPDKVVVKIYGKTINDNYMHLLHDYPNFDMELVYLLDQVQKGLTLERSQYKRLHEIGVIEGRSPNVYISSYISEIINEKVQYIKNRGQNDQYYRQMIISYLERWGQGTKRDFLELLIEKFPDILSSKQKDDKVRTLLARLRRDGQIFNIAKSKRGAVWELTQRTRQ